jgi:hypothetical protein
MTMASKMLKAMIEPGESIAAPGVFDLFSAKIADRTDEPEKYADLLAVETAA